MGILSLCADSGCPPGHTMSSSSSPDPDNPLTKMSLHVISASSPHYGRTPPPAPTRPLPAIHNRLFTQTTLWLQTTLQTPTLLTVFVFLGLFISWIPLTAFLFSTLCMSICLTAEEELALTVNELKEMHYNRTWTTRKQQQQHQDRITDAPALDSSQQHSHPVTGLHDISAFTSALKLQANHLPRPQKHTSTCTQRPWPNNWTLTTFSASKQHQQQHGL
jgi:hypothetical protein